MTAAAAILFALVCAGAIVFQLALAAGAPWGGYAMGGRFPGRLPPAMRVSAVVQAVVLGVLALVVMAAGGLMLADLAEAVPWLVWLAVAFSAVSLVLNLVTPSAVERRIWAPVAVVLLVTSLVVALSPA